MSVIYRKFAGLLLATVLFGANAIAAESDNVSARFKEYWAAYVAGNYIGAAKLIHPDDLAGVQAQILPIFVKGLEATDPKLNEIAAAYFDGVPDAKRKTLSGAEAMAQLMNFIALASPEAIEMIKSSRMEVSDVSFDAKSPDKAVVKFNLVMADGSGSDFEQLSKLNGTWFMRSKETPAATAAKLKAAFQR